MAVLACQCLCDQIRQLLLFLKCTDDLLGALLVTELRILENVRRSACIDLHIIFDVDDLSYGVQHMPDYLAVYAGLFLQPCNQAECDLIDRHPVQCGVEKHIQLQQILIA